MIQFSCHLEKIKHVSFEIQSSNIFFFCFITLDRMAKEPQYSIHRITLKFNQPKLMGGGCWMALWLAQWAFKRDIVGSNPARVKIIFRPLVRLAYTRRVLGWVYRWTGWRLVTDSGTKCAWVIHESKAVQIHVHNNRRCLYVPRVPGSVKNPHNNNNNNNF